MSLSLVKVLFRLPLCFCKIIFSEIQTCVNPSVNLRRVFVCVVDSFWVKIVQTESVGTKGNVVQIIRNTK